MAWCGYQRSQTGRQEGWRARTPYKEIMGNTPNISKWLDFYFYDWCWFWDKLTDEKAHIGRILGVAHQIGSDMCYWILSNKNKVIAQTTTQRVIKEDLESVIVKEKMKQFDTNIEEKMNEWGHVIQAPASGLILDDEGIDDNNKPKQPTLPDQDDFTDEAFDAYLGAELMVPHGDT